MSAQGVRARHTNVSTMPAIRQKAVTVCTALLTPSSFPAPKHWEIMIVAPEASPLKKPRTRLIMTAGLPATAARASVPTKRPTMMASTVLYSCWKSMPIIMGMKKPMSFFQTLPEVRSFLSFLSMIPLFIRRIIFSRSGEFKHKCIVNGYITIISTHIKRVLIFIICS